jgi:hypothetical protein
LQNGGGHVALQSENLVMVGLGVLNDQPPNTVQPTLPDGVLLRWSFKKEAGFPWYGYYLFRRVAQRLTPVCLSTQIKQFPALADPKQLPTSLGTFSSDQNLAFTDDFAPSGQQEIDLRNRTRLRFTAPAAQPARLIQARVGLRSSVGSASSGDIVFQATPVVERILPNPYTEGGATFTLVADNATIPDLRVPPAGALPSGLQLGPDGIASSEIRVHLPPGTTNVEVFYSWQNAAVVEESFDSQGNSLGRTSTVGATSDSGSFLVQLAVSEIRIRTSAPTRTRVRRVTFGGASSGDIVFLNPAPKILPDPYTESGVTFRLIDFHGALFANMRVLPAGALPTGLQLGPEGSADSELRIQLPPGTTSVDLFLSWQNAAIKVEGFDPQGIFAGGTQNEGFTSETNVYLGFPRAVADIRIQTSAPSQTVLHRLSFRAAGSGKEIHVRAYGQDVLIAEQSLAGASGTVVDAVFKSDLLTAIEIDGGDAALVDLCVAGAATDASHGWEPLQQRPIGLPVTHPLYPLSAPWTGNDVRARVLYAKPADLNTIWSDAVVQDLKSHLATLVAGGPNGPPMAQVSQQVSATSTTASRSPYPVMPRQSALDLVLLAALNPGMAQALGLYYVDATATPEVDYDYLIVADYTGVGKAGAATPLAANILALVEQNRFDQFDAWIVFNKTKATAPPLSAPVGVKVFSLPGGTVTGAGGSIQEGQNNAALSWDLGATDQGRLLPERPILYHVWRADLQNSTAPAAGGTYNLITTNGPVLVVQPILPPAATPTRPSDWPPVELALFFTDRGLTDGWYGYQMNGIDLFGRHTANSAPAAWYQWSPAPDPRPWYYQDPPANSVVHASAVRLLDKIPPPEPTGVEAWVLDPADPMLLRDTPYQDWHNALPSSELDTLVGLRVRWHWTVMHMRQAPDTREFRIYFHPGTNPPDPDHSIPLYWQQRYYVVGYESNVTKTLAPASSAAGLKLTGLLAAVAGSVVSLDGTPDLSALLLMGEHLSLDADTARPDKTYRIIAVDDTTKKLTLEAAPNTGGALTAWQIGFPLRTYEVFIPGTGDTVRADVLPVPTQADPLLFANIGVSAADDKTTTLDAPQWASGHWGNRFGNEGRIGAPAKIYRVRRTPPDPPELPVFGDRVYATVADYNHSSFFTFHWPKQPNLQAHIYRALDDTLFQIDWSIRFARFPLDPANPEAAALFPNGWTPAQMQSVSAELNKLASPADYATLSKDAQTALATLPGNAPLLWDKGLQQRDWALRHSRTGLAPSDAFFPAVFNTATRQLIVGELNQIKDAAGYLTLSDSALRVLAGLPGNERAFSQITIQPLPANPGENEDHRGPDDPESYPPNGSLLAFQDTLDGRARNRYFYRAAYVDKVHNRGEMSLSTPPVYLPDVEPPPAPSIVKVLGGDREAVLSWTAASEASVVRTLLYRTTDKEKTREARLFGAPLASLPSRVLVASGGAIDLGVDIDAKIVERVYDARQLGPNDDPFSGGAAQQYLAAPVAPTVSVVSGLTAPDGTEVVAIYRDFRGGMQRTPVPNLPDQWRDAALPPTVLFYYALASVKRTLVNGRQLEIHSRLSAVAAAKAFDVAPPDPAQWQIAELVKVDASGLEHPFTEAVAVFTPAVKLVWVGLDPAWESMVERKSGDALTWESITPWLVAAMQFRDDAVEAGIVYQYRIKARKSNGKTSVSSARQVPGF